METTTLAVRPQLTPETWQLINAIAPTMKDARLFGVATEAQAAAIMIKGHELGLGLASSFEFITVIQDKPTLVPRGALALIYGSGELTKMDIKDEVDASGKPSACTVTMTRRGKLTYTARFTMEDALRAKLVKAGGAWDAYPANMLRWRAIGYCADVLFPDVIGGLKRADEFGADLTPDGEVIEGSWTAAPEQPNGNGTGTQGSQPEPQAQPLDATLYLARLTKQYGAKAIIDANEGIIPGTVDELKAVEVKLAA